MKVAGVDEVGRGCLAGPVVACAVILPQGYRNRKIKDSKVLCANARKELSEVIKEKSLAWAIAAIGPREIETLNIREASRRAMKWAVEAVNPDFVLVDGNVALDIAIPQETIIGGDALRIEISAASIVAKVWRDELMETFDKRFPGYGLARHVGYATKAHKSALCSLGITPIHRRTFCGVVELLEEE
jgi:ribonuclease HII